LDLQSGRRPSWGKIAVVVAIAGAVVFGVAVAYFEFVNDSFPTEQRSFGDYAMVTSTSFNGTELAYTVNWLSADYIPLYVQVTSPTSDQANTPVCDLRYSSGPSGQSIFMPFSMAQPAQGLKDVDLSIAVRPVGGGGDFTIVYHLDSVFLNVQGNVEPSTLTCQQAAGAM
jgi:hypothetical protein